MEGLKQRFERIESEHNIIDREKETIITLNDLNDKDHDTIDLGLMMPRKNSDEYQTMSDNQSNLKTI